MYVGGGNTANLPAVWRVHGLDRLLGEAYDSTPGRRPSYRKAVATGMLPAGWAVEDGVGVLFTGGRLADTVTRTTGACLYQVESAGENEAGERAVPCRSLGESAVGPWRAP